MPWTLPSLGARISLPKEGWFRYQVAKEAGHRYVLNMEWDTSETIQLEADLVIPELDQVSHWSAPAGKEPDIPIPNRIWRPARHSMTWVEPLVAGRHRVVRQWRSAV